MVNGVGFVISEREKFALEPKTRLQSLTALCGKSFIKVKRDRESFWHRHQKRPERVSPSLVLAKHYTIFQLITNNRPKEYLKVIKELPDQLPKHTSCDNISRRLARKNEFLLRRNVYSSKILCCYIIIRTELKEKDIFEQEVLVCCVIISSGLKQS